MNLRNYYYFCYMEKMSIPQYAEKNNLYRGTINKRIKTAETNGEKPDLPGVIKYEKVLGRYILHVKTTKK